MDTTVLTELIGQYGYLGIALLIALENIFPPIPSEVVLTFTGFLTLTAGLNVLGAISSAIPRYPYCPISSVKTVVSIKILLLS